MAFCKACGTELGGAAFCPKCGASQSASGSPAGVSPGAVAVSAGSATEGMGENVAGLLAYLFGWITGLIFLLIDKRSFVKFHGAQAIALDISFSVVAIVLWICVAILTAITLAIFHFPFGFLGVFLFPVMVVAYLVAKIFAMYKAYQHEKFKFPIIGNIVEKMVG